MKPGRVDLVLEYVVGARRAAPQGEGRVVASSGVVSTVVYGAFIEPAELTATEGAQTPLRLGIVPPRDPTFVVQATTLELRDATEKVLASWPYSPALFVQDPNDPLRRILDTSFTAPSGLAGALGLHLLFLATARVTDPVSGQPQTVEASAEAPVTVKPAVSPLLAVSFTGPATLEVGAAGSLAIEITTSNPSLTTAAFRLLLADGTEVQSASIDLSGFQVAGNTMSGTYGFTAPAAPGLYLLVVSAARREGESPDEPPVETSSFQSPLTVTPAPEPEPWVDITTPSPIVAVEGQEVSGDFAIGPPSIRPLITGIKWKVLDGATLLFSGLVDPGSLVLQGDRLAGHFSFTVPKGIVSAPTDLTLQVVAEIAGNLVSDSCVLRVSPAPEEPIALSVYAVPEPPVFETETVEYRFLMTPPEIFPNLLGGTFALLERETGTQLFVQNIDLATLTVNSHITGAVSFEVPVGAASAGGGRLDMVLKFWTDEQAVSTSAALDVFERPALAFAAPAPLQVEECAEFAADFDLTPVESEPSGISWKLITVDGLRVLQEGIVDPASLVRMADGWRGLIPLFPPAGSHEYSESPGVKVMVHSLIAGYPQTVSAEIPSIIRAPVTLPPSLRPGWVVIAAPDESGDVVVSIPGGAVLSSSWPIGVRIATTQCTYHYTIDNPDRDRCFVVKAAAGSAVVITVTDGDGRTTSASLDVPAEPPVSLKMKPGVVIPAIVVPFIVGGEGAGFDFTGTRICVPDGIRIVTSQVLHGDWICGVVSIAEIPAGKYPISLLSRAEEGNEFHQALAWLDVDPAYERRIGVQVLSPVSGATVDEPEIAFSGMTDSACCSILATNYVEGKVFSGTVGVSYEAGDFATEIPLCEGENRVVVSSFKSVDGVPWYGKTEFVLHCDMAGAGATANIVEPECAAYGFPIVQTLPQTTRIAAAGLPFGKAYRFRVRDGEMNVVSELFTDSGEGWLESKELGALGRVEVGHELAEFGQVVKYAPYFVLDFSNRFCQCFVADFWIQLWGTFFNWYLEWMNFIGKSVRHDLMNMGQAPDEPFDPPPVFRPPPAPPRPIPKLGFWPCHWPWPPPAGPVMLIPGIGGHFIILPNPLFGKIVPGSSAYYNPNPHLLIPLGGAPSPINMHTAPDPSALLQFLQHLGITQFWHVNGPNFPAGQFTAKPADRMFFDNRDVVSNAVTRDGTFVCVGEWFVVDVDCTHHGHDGVFVQSWETLGSPFKRDDTYRYKDDDTLRIKLLEPGEVTIRATGGFHDAALSADLKVIAVRARLLVNDTVDAPEAPIDGHLDDIILPKNTLSKFPTRGLTSVTVRIEPNPLPKPITFWVDVTGAGIDFYATPFTAGSVPNRVAKTPALQGGPGFGDIHWYGAGVGRSGAMSDTNIALRVVPGVEDYIAGDHRLLEWHREDVTVVYFEGGLDVDSHGTYRYSLKSDTLDSEEPAVTFAGWGVVRPAGIAVQESFGLHVGFVLNQMGATGDPQPGAWNESFFSPYIPLSDWSRWFESPEAFEAYLADKWPAARLEMSHENNRDLNDTAEPNPPIYSTRGAAYKPVGGFLQEVESADTPVNLALHVWARPQRNWSPNNEVEVYYRLDKVVLKGEWRVWTVLHRAGTGYIFPVREARWGLNVTCQMLATGEQNVTNATPFAYDSTDLTTIPVLDRVAGDVLADVLVREATPGEFGRVSATRIIRR